MTYASSRLPIEIDAEYKADRLLISVSDRGPGLPAEPVERVFEKFFRGNGRKTGGPGLDCLSREAFVEAHGGTLTAENRDGGVARAVSLPVRVIDVTTLESRSRKQVSSP